MTTHKFRGRWVASIALAAVISGASVLLVTGGAALGSSAAQYQYGAPTNTALPAVSGNAAVGKTLTTSNGTWTSDAANSTITYAYAWSRCDTAGNNCTAISGATATTYAVVAADQGHTIRSVVTATNASGATQAQSAPSAAVSTTGGTIAAANVVLPNLLTIDHVTYSQNPIKARKTPTTMRIHVTDQNQNSVQGALVFVQGVPYSRIANTPEVQTDATGWATVNIQPAKNFPRTGYITMFVRARVSGQDLLAGSSTRRLVQATIAAPNGT
jgi:hypothetical protein